MKRLLAFFVIICCVLAGCASPAEDKPIPTPAATEEAFAPEGSAAHIDGRTVLFTVFLDDGETLWTEEDKAIALQYMDMAAEYIEEQAASFGAETELIRGEEGLLFDMHAADTATETSEQRLELAEDIDEFIAENADIEKIKSTYAAEGIGFMVLINKTGISYTLPCYSAKTEGFNEKCFMYLRAQDNGGEYEAPAAYAHEILHLFGAVDLYKADTQDGVSEALAEHVGQKYSYDIMYNTYLADGSASYTAIPQRFSPVTAYCLGLSEDIRELEMFPELAEKIPCVF